MLLKDFYIVKEHTGPVTETSVSGGISTRFSFALELNPSHPVYLGHFPGNPVVPGVCQIMMIKELICLIENKEMKLEHADTVKFLSLIVPEKNKSLNFDISCRETGVDKLSATVTIHADNTTFLKFKGIFSGS